MVGLVHKTLATNEGEAAAIPGENDVAWPPGSEVCHAVTRERLGGGALLTRDRDMHNILLYAGVGINEMKQ